jgi:hypothetical protein
VACTETTLRLLEEVIDAFGIRVRIGTDLVVAGCKALFSALKPHVVDIPAEIRAAHLRIRSRSVSRLRQKSFIFVLVYQNQIPFALSVAGVSEKRANWIVYCMFAV